MKTKKKFYPFDFASIAGREILVGKIRLPACERLDNRNVILSVRNSKIASFYVSALILFPVVDIQN